MTDRIDLEAFLRQRGHRVTNPRRFVWDVLAAAGGHLTAEQIAGRVQDRDHRINLASIYRSLTLFADLGLARESNLGTDGAGGWEMSHPDDEFHLICDRCGDVQHHGGDLVEQVRSHLGGDHGFQAVTIELSVTGLCSSCAA
jgi:Fur family ferric uptake transcriptional regulator